MGIIAASIHFETDAETLLGGIRGFLGMRGYNVGGEGDLSGQAELSIDSHFASQFVKNIRQKETRNFVIMPSLKGWLTLVEDGCHSLGDQDLAASLAGRLGCRVAYVVISEEAGSILYVLYDGMDEIESLWMVEGVVTEHNGLPEDVPGAANVAQSLKAHLGKTGLRRLSYRYEDFRDPGFEPVEFSLADCRRMSLRRRAGITDTQQVMSLAGAEAGQALRVRAEEFYRKYTMSDAQGMYEMEVPVLSMLGDLNTVQKYVEAVKARVPRADEIRIEGISFEDPEMRQAKVKCTFLKAGEVVRVKNESWQKGALYAFMPNLRKSDHETWFHNIQAKGDYE